MIPLINNPPPLPAAVPAAFHHAVVTPDVPWGYVIDAAFAAATQSIASNSTLPPMEYADRISIPEKSPFRGCEWHLFHPGYTGPIPFDGISFQDFRFLEKTYQNIVNGVTPFVIQDNPQTIDFRRDVLDAFKRALTRPSSRALVLELLNHPNIRIVIAPTQNSASEVNFGRTEREILINLTPQPGTYATRASLNHPPQPNLTHPHIRLLHELSHAQQMLNPANAANLQRRPNYRIDYDNREEEIVIQAENTFRAEFGLPLRVGHGGFRGAHRHRGVPPQPTLHDYAYNGCINEVRQCLDQGIPCNDAQGQSQPLLAAAARGHFEIVDLLLLRGANLLSRDSKGKTLAHALIKAGNVEQLTRYVQAGIISIPQHDIGPIPLLHTALKELRAEAEPMIQFLIIHGANVQALNAEGKNILHVAAEISDLRFFREFARAGNNPHALTTTSNELPLHFALFAGNYPLARELLTPQNLFHLTTRGDTLLTYALASYSPETVQLIIEAEQLFAQNLGNPPFNLARQTNLQGLTPLNQALVHHNHHPMQRRWIAHYIKEGVVLSALNSPLKQAETEKLITLFAKAESPLREQYLQAIYAQNPAWINNPLCYQLPLLHWAAYKGDINLIRLAIQLGADVNLLSQGYPLFIAIEHNHYEIAALLLSLGANPNLTFNGLNATQYIHQRSLRPRVCFDPRFRNLLAT